MSGDRADRLGLAAGVVTWAAVALPALAPDGGAGPGPAWWAAWGVNGLLFVAAGDPRVERRVALARSLLAVQVAAGAVAYALDAGYGFTGVLLVLNAVTAAFVVPPGVVAGVVTGQTLLVGATVAGDLPGPSAVTVAAAYGGLQVFGVIMVVTGQREARARRRLAELNAELVAAQAVLAERSRSAERLRIARDLHDTLGHGLTALAVQLEVASHLVDGAAAEPVHRARTVARDLLADVRDVVGRLRETPDDLTVALRAVADGIPRPRVHLSVAPEVPADDPERTEALLRCVQEVVTNAVRHADADNVWIDVGTAGSATLLRAHDDGRGVGRVEPGNGLSGMRERVEGRGGELAVWSREGEGFRVVARLP